jgi:hypothetical protein
MAKRLGLLRVCAAKQPHALSGTVRATGQRFRVTPVAHIDGADRLSGRSTATLRPRGLLGNQHRCMLTECAFEDAVTGGGRYSATGGAPWRWNCCAEQRGQVKIEGGRVVTGGNDKGISGCDH